MKHYNLKNIKQQAGMTLIELTVVLLILIGLAGLLIPYVGSFVQKTHDSTNSSNLSQLNNAMGRFIAEKNRLPAHMSALINNSSGAASGTGSCATGFVDPNGATYSNAAGDIYCGMLDPSVFTALTPAATTAGTENIFLNSLKKAGFDMFVNNKASSANKTFDSEEGMKYLDDPFAGTSTNAFASINAAGKSSVAAHLSAAVGGASMDYHVECYDYIAFGLGDKNEMVGNVMQASPVHFPENPELGPVQRFNHYVAIFQVDKSNTATYQEGMPAVTKSCSPTTERAKFLGVAMNVPHYTGSYLFGSGAALSYTYENAVTQDR